MPALLLITAAGLALAVVAAVEPPARPPTAATLHGVKFRNIAYEGADAPHAPRPILPGSYPDPSICRVGPDYYLVNSTFAYFPGIPIFHSTDLVAWNQIGHVLTRPSQLNLAGRAMTAGIFASTLRHHNGTFYVISTDAYGIGNFVVTATSPAGPWSDPTPLPDVQGIDPSLFFDEEAGKAYIIHNGDAPDHKPLYSGHRALYLLEFDPATLKTTTPPRLLINGGTDLAKKPIWIEGPHIYKVDGWYILMAAEGGTGPEHSEVVFRSRTIDGPFEPYPHNPILTQRHLPASRPNAVTCAGHADLVQAPDGAWSAVFLACRQPDASPVILGRETFLLPVSWHDGWPTFPTGLDPIQPPASPAVPPTPVAISDDFPGPTLAPAWNFLRTPPADPDQQWWAFAPQGGLLLAPRTESLDGKGNPSFIARRQQHADCSLTTTVSASRETPDCDAGLAIIQDESHHAFLAVRFAHGLPTAITLNRRNGGKSPTELLKSVPLPSSAPDGIGLRITAHPGHYTFSFRAPPPGFDTAPWTDIATVDDAFLNVAATQGFIGAYFGPYARATDVKALAVP